MPRPDWPDRLTAARVGGDWFHVVESPAVILSAGPGNFEWIAGLKEYQALRLVQRSAGQVDRIGLDEYEWLREKSSCNA